ncbi:hypothetical protein QF044_002768 [Chryseobacterium sp. W4I1]|nr:hypothetical protein [Chryseobacterium sp. W4I1]
MSMKKILTVLGITAASFVYSQGRIIVNNYSKYDFHGFLITTNSTTGCYPRAGNSGAIVIPAECHMGNGLALVYEGYRDQFISSLYPTTNWEVTVNPLTSSIMAWDDVNLAPVSTIATTTKWYATKFDMTEPGTNISVQDFHTNLNIANPCSPGIMDYYVTPSGNNSAEMFTIGSITYLQLF